MIDIDLLREDPKKFKEATAAKQIDPGSVDKVLKLDEKLRQLILKGNQLNEEKNKIARMASASSDKGLQEKGRKNKKERIRLRKKLEKWEKEFGRVIREIPNPPARDVKTGKNESENEVVKEWGNVPKFNFEPKDHLAIGETLGVIDMEKAAKVSGTRFGYLKGDAAILEFALVQLALETLTKEGFIPIVPPVLMKVPVFHNLGYSEHMGHGNYYFVLGDPERKSQGEEEEGYYLVGTSEHSVVPYFMDQTLNAKDLPKRFVSFSTCFRREAGSYGKDTKGIFRVHQFDKVEMISFTKPEESDKEHEYLLSLEEQLFQTLKIPYRVVKMCSGDLGAPAVRKYDLEAWMPGQGAYREVTSTSNCTDFQARRLNIKYKEGDKTGYAHTLNGTALAIGRAIIAILENYQEKDGSVVVPEVLQKWMGKEKITP